MSASPFTPAARRAAMLEGGFSAAWVALAGGVFLAGFAVELQANNIVQGFLASLPFMAAIAQISGAYVIEAHGKSRRHVAIGGLLASRLTFLLVIPAAFLFLPVNRPLMLAVYVALACVAYLCQSFANVAWLSWMGDLVPDGQRGAFFGGRNLMAGFVTVLAVALGGQLAGYRFGDLPSYTGYLILFAIAGGFGLLGAFTLSRVKTEPRVVIDRSVNFFRSMREPLKKKDFRHFLMFHLCWMSAVYLASPFFNFYFLQDLKLDIGFVALTNTVSTIAGLTTIQLWGSLCDRFGSKPVLYVTLSIASFIPLAYVFTNDGNIHWVAMTMQAVSGAAWAGIGLAASNLLLKLAPREKNSVYLSTFGALSGVSTALAPIAAGFVAEAAKSWTFTAGGLTLYHFKFIFLASFVARSASVLLLIRIPETDEHSATEVVRALGTWRTLWTVSGFDLVQAYFVLPLHRRLKPIVEGTVGLTKKWVPGKNDDENL
jgi:MFS family permease